MQTPVVPPAPTRAPTAQTRPSASYSHVPAREHTHTAIGLRAHRHTHVRMPAVDYHQHVSRRQSPGITAVRALAVIPTYNELENLRLLLPQVLEHPGVHVLVVDDNSPDGSADFVRAFASQAPGRVHLLQRPSKLGLGTAYVAGFRWALQRTYTHVIQMDADFSHHPATIQRLLQAARTSDLVLGSRNVPGGRTVDWPLRRKVLSRAGSFYARTVLSLPVRDLTGGFKCFRRAVLEAIDLDDIQSSGYSFQIELTYRAALLGFRITEIPITFAERAHGTSKMNTSIVREAIVRVWQMRFSVPRAMRTRGVQVSGTTDADATTLQLSR